MQHKEYLRKYLTEHKGKPLDITWYSLGLLAGLTGSKEQISKAANDFWRQHKKKILGDKQTILVVGDLHIPYEKEGYLEFCKKIYDKEKCNKIIFIGDLIDNHFASYHTTDPKTTGGRQELLLSTEKLAKWYEVFPSATVILGNHDRIIQRKVFDSGIPKEWLKEFNEVLGVPGWEFVEDYEFNGVYYVHGVGTTARITALRNHMCTIQGHRHTECYIQYIAPGIFGAQCPTGIDRKSYAFDYMKFQTNPIYNGCLTITSKNTPTIHLMS